MKPQSIIELRPFEYGVSCAIPHTLLQHHDVMDYSLKMMESSLIATIYGRDVFAIIVPRTWWDGFKLWVKSFTWLPSVITNHINVRTTKIATAVLYPDYSPEVLGKPVRFAEYSVNDVIERRVHDHL